MTYKEALLLSYDKWVWLFQNPGECYTKWVRYGEIEDMRASCPLCQFFNSECTVCVLYHHNGCGINFSAFLKWAQNDDLRVKKLAAARIAGILRRELRKEERRGV